jgi:hypothetical protein
VKTEALSGSAVVLAVIGGGTALSFASAVLPHYDGAYRLQPLIFFSGLVLYLVYGVLAHFEANGIQSELDAYNALIPD